ncbi:DUF4268 domain-containing protein [Micromonospora sp. URMC 107]|uniref:DUF4268 domain-containing protein n=1 Tax=Micromonospora sp. URMC 107 TaxID=3423418 RepID=UPI003F193831
MTSGDGSGDLPALGRLDSVDIREVWKHEAHSFTPWLLANADVLGKVLGMELALSAAEHPVGGFWLDLIGVDESTGEKVIIENQLERTDHSHLGQLLTYAGGTDPVNIVWLAAGFREEHRAALDWLNTRTDEKTRFFGIEIAAVRIGESVPAPLLRLVAQPNDWGKQVRSIAQADAATSSRNLAYQEFWGRFLETLRTQNLHWTASTKGRPENWLSLPTGSSDIIYACTFAKAGLGSEMFFQHRDPAVNDTRFATARTKLEPLCPGLSFEPLVGRKGCRIVEYRDGDIADTDRWHEYIAWFIDAQLRLRRAIDQAGGMSAVISTVVGSSPA